jgi:hypothetical protein
MSIFESIFGKAAPETPVATPAAAPPPAAPGAEISAAGGTPQPEASPLDAFKDLFKMEPPKSGETSEQNPFAIDPDSIFKSAQTTDFTKAIDNDTLAKIGGGGEEAQQAFLVAMNKMNQMSYAYAAMLATKMAEQASSHTLTKVKSLVPDLVRQMRVNEEFSDSHPALNHPATAPMIAALVTQFSAKHPEVSPKEIKKMAADYLVNVGKLFNSNEQSENLGLVDKTNLTPRKPAETDWSKFL